MISTTEIRQVIEHGEVIEITRMTSEATAASCSDAENLAIITAYMPDENE